LSNNNFEYDDPISMFSSFEAHALIYQSNDMTLSRRNSNFETKRKSRISIPHFQVIKYGAVFSVQSLWPIFNPHHKKP
jgi:hypothetical protein